MAKVKLKDVIKRVNTRVDKDNTNLIYYVGGEHFDSEQIRVTRRGLINGGNIGSMFNYGFKAGDFLLESRNPHLKKAGVVDFDGICSKKTFVLATADSSMLIPKYLPFILQNDVFWNYAYKHRHGSVNTFITWPTLADYEFDLPSIEMQKKISYILWAIVDTVDAYKKMIKVTDELVESKFTEMFMHNHKYPLVPLGMLVDRNIKKKKDIEDKYDEIFYIDISSVDNEKKKIVGYKKYTVENAPSRAQQVLSHGDILVSTVRPNLKNVAINNYSEENMVASTAFCVLRSLHCLPEYIFGVVSSDDFTQNMCDNACGINYPIVSYNTVLNYLVPNPPLSIQKKFSDIFNQSNKSKLNLEKALSDLLIFFKYFLRKF